MMKITFLILATLATIASSNVIKPTFLTDEYINSINQKQSTWVAGRNFPEGTTLEELRRLSGAILEPVNATQYKAFVAHEDIPHYFDARERWPECQSIREIRDQGSCGSCWAFGAVEAMSDRFCIATGGEYFKFSAEQLVSCCSQCGTCSGGTSLASWQYWVDNGIVSGGDYSSNHGCQPYGEKTYRYAENPVCEGKCTNDAYSTSFEQDKRFGASSYMISSDVRAIQSEIMTNGPVEAYFSIHSDFYSYQFGIYQTVDEQSTSSGHFMKILGWGEENGTPYWLVANSWGTHWGALGGFVKILRGSNHCNIEGYITAGMPKI